MASERPPEEAAWACREASAAIGGFWDQVEAHWVNHPHANERANRKPEQLSRARRRGFGVPPTLITNCTDELRAFAAAHDEVVCKAIKNGQVPAPTANDPDLMLYTTSVAQSSLTNLEDFGPEPYLFQARIPKCHDLRVTVIGDQAFGCRILSQAAPDGTVDWRRADTPELRHEPAE
jgi:glutathione synthase/RimK-type ligase-like ATP-grasp enzyme